MSDENNKLVAFLNEDNVVQHVVIFKQDAEDSLIESVKNELSCVLSLIAEDPTTSPGWIYDGESLSDPNKPPALEWHNDPANPEIAHLLKENGYTPENL